MRLFRRAGPAGADPTRLRFTDELTGLLVLGAVVLFAAAVFQAGVLRQWLHADDRLQLILPQNGTDGLAPGADVEVLGIHAGTVRRIRLNPTGDMYAIALIDTDAEPFIRRDSEAVIRRRFAVAGDAYVDISRGKGETLDWHYAVLRATTAPDPIATITRTIDQVRAALIPTLDNARTATADLAAVVAGLKAGHGSAGKLLTDDALFGRAETALATLDDVLARLGPIEARVGPIEARAGSAIGHADRAAANLQGASADARRAARDLPAISANARRTTDNLPSLVTEAEATADQLRGLIVQLRHSWLLGGGGGGGASDRLPPARAQP